MFTSLSDRLTATFKNLRTKGRLSESDVNKTVIGSLGSNGNYDAMYAVVLTVAFIGFAADRLYQLFQDRMLRWQQ